jgi:hypothetical protein
VPEQIITLEKAVQMWEDFCLLANYTARSCFKQGQKVEYNFAGPFVHFTQLRQALQNRKNFEDTQIFCQKFCENRKSGQPTILGDLDCLPFELLLWMSCSKRVYHLTYDLELLLNATTVNNVTWQQISLPFPAFAITLDEPILGTTLKNNTYDTLLISFYPTSYGCPFLEIRLISNKIKNYQRLTADQKNVMARLFSQGKFDKLGRHLKKHVDNITGSSVSPRFTLPWHERIITAKVTESITELTQRFINECQAKVAQEQNVLPMPTEGNTAIRLVVGLCLYLTTRLAKKGVSSRNYHCPKAKQPDLPTPIYDLSQIFTLSTVRQLTSAEKTQFADGLSSQIGSHTEKCPHFRQGTWRFPPNKANQPGAQKTVHVQPCIVNAHKLPPGQQPNGSKVKL